MASTLLDAEDGLTETTRALDRLNLDVKDFTGLNPEQQFFKFADALAKVEDDSKRAALAQDIFGRAGTELLPLFREGEEGLAALAAQAERLGIVYSQEAAANAAKFKDAQNVLSKALQGALAKGIAPLIPKLIEMIDSIVENEELLNSMGKAVVFVAEKFARFVEEIGIVIEGVQTFTKAIEDSVGQIDKILDQIPGIFSNNFEDAYNDSIRWIAKGKLLRHIQSLPGSIKDALAPIPGIFGDVFGKAYNLAIGDFLENAPHRWANVVEEMAGESQAGMSNRLKRGSWRLRIGL